MVIMNALLKRLRTEKNLSVSQISSALEISQKEYQDYELGRKSLKNAKTDLVIRMCQALGCSVEYLIEFDAGAASQEHSARRILQYMKDLTPPSTVGSVAVFVDGLFPYVENTFDGRTEEVAFLKIESRSYLRRFSKLDGWGIDWTTCPKNVEVFSVVTVEDGSVQGLVGLRRDDDFGAAYIYWACVAPQNDLYYSRRQRYRYVAGNLFAIACQKSMEWGFGGLVYGFAADRKMLEHYELVLDATFVGTLQAHMFMLDFTASRAIMRVYEDVWS